MADGGLHGERRGERRRELQELDPSSTNSDLRASIDFDERDDVVIDYSPKWSDRRYEVLGKARLSDEEWEPADSSHRFFRVKVELP